MSHTPDWLRRWGHTAKPPNQEPRPEADDTLGPSEQEQNNEKELQERVQETLKSIRAKGNR